MVLVLVLVPSCLLGPVLPVGRTSVTSIGIGALTTARISTAMCALPEQERGRTNAAFIAVFPVSLVVLLAYARSVLCHRVRKQIAD